MTTPWRNLRKYWLVLLLIAAPVSVLSTLEAKATSPAHQQWEYKQVFRHRGWDKKTTTGPTVSVMGIPIPNVSTDFWWTFGDWKTSDGDADLPAGTDIKGLLAKLGRDGWELVSVTPISSFAGSSHQTDGALGLAGATTEVTYWFKRPKR